MQNTVTLIAIVLLHSAPKLSGSFDFSSLCSTRVRPCSVPCQRSAAVIRAMMETQ